MLIADGVSVRERSKENGVRHSPSSMYFYALFGCIRTATMSSIYEYTIFSDFFVRDTLQSSERANSTKM